MILHDIIYHISHIRDAFLLLEHPTNTPKKHQHLSPPSEMLHGICLLSQADRGDEVVEQNHGRLGIFVSVSFNRFNAQESILITDQDWRDLKKCCDLHEPISVSVWVWNGWKSDFPPEDRDSATWVCLTMRDASQFVARLIPTMMRKPEFCVPYAQRNPHHVVFLWAAGSRPGLWPSPKPNSSMFSGPLGANSKKGNRLFLWLQSITIFGSEL